MIGVLPKTLLLVMVVAVTLSACSLATPRELRPLDLGWERHLSLTWETTERRGRPVVAGTVQNTSAYDLANIRVLVDGLDDGGQVVAQRVGWVIGELRGGGHLFFEVPVAAAARYHVRVFSYDRLECAGRLSSL